MDGKISSIGILICYLLIKICYMGSSFCLNILVSIGYDTGVDSLKCIEGLRNVGYIPISYTRTPVHVTHDSHGEQG